MSVVLAASRVKWFLKQHATNKIFEVNPTDFRVGRNVTAHIILNSNKTSRTHSSLVVNVEGQLLVQDLKSVNGTFVNGTQIEVYVWHKIQHGDIISFGISSDDLIECEKDKNTFFEVIMEVPKAKDSGQPVLINLADSTTSLPDEDLNSEIPSSSGVNTKEPTVIIDLVESSDESSPTISKVTKSFKKPSSSNLRLPNKSVTTRKVASTESTSSETNFDDVNILDIKMKRHSLPVMYNTKNRRADIVPNSKEISVFPKVDQDIVDNEPEHGGIMNEEAIFDKIKGTGSLREKKTISERISEAAVINRKIKSKESVNSDKEKNKLTKNIDALHMQQLEIGMHEDKSPVSEEENKVQVRNKRGSKRKLSKNSKKESNIISNMKAVEHKKTNTKETEKNEKIRTSKRNSAVPDLFNDDLLQQLDNAISGDPPSQQIKGKKDFLKSYAEESNKIKHINKTQNSSQKVNLDEDGEVIFKPRSVDSKIIEISLSNKNNKEDQVNTKENELIDSVLAESGTEMENQEKCFCPGLCTIHKRQLKIQDNLIDKEIDKERDDCFININADVDNAKSPEKRFSTNKDNSVVIDITGDDDEDDFSCSQIFQMSAIVKTEVTDNNFQKIKQELAEMDYCQEEILMNQMPINLENDFNFSGFENTQEICAYLESDDNSSNSNKPCKMSDFGELNSSEVSNNMNMEVDTTLVSKNNLNDSADSPNSSENSINTSKFYNSPGDNVTSKNLHIKDLPKKLKNENKTKRKNSMEESTVKKKLKSNMKSPPLLSKCDSKTIMSELKKRHSNNEQKIEKSVKETIKEERRKKLKEITKRSDNRTSLESKCEKGTTVKVLPVSKTNRGGFLCEEPSSSKARLEPVVSKKELKYRVIPIDLPKLPKSSQRNGKSVSEGNAENSRANNLREPSFPNQRRYNLRTSSSTNVNAQYNIPQSVVEPKIPGGMVPQVQVPVNVKQLARNQDVRVHNANSTRTTHNVDSGSITWMQHHGIGDYQSSRLMFPNTGQSKEKRPRRHTTPFNTDDIVHKIVHWLPNWLVEQIDVDVSPPVNDPPAEKIPLNFRNFDQYYSVFSKLVLLEMWHYLFKGFRESIEQPRRVKIEHTRIVNDLLYIDCECYITRDELRKGHFYKTEDFLLIECKAKDSQNNHYLSLNFGFIQKCRRTEISDHDVISVNLGDTCSGEPHTRLQFTIVTRYQSDKQINPKGFMLLKLLANVGAYLKQFRAIKSLVNSPLCHKILYPKINEYKYPVTHRDVVHPNALNPQQKLIVLEAASLCTGKSDGIYCIKGPPGTGKSSVIVNIVFQILTSCYITKETEEPPLILLAAPSNTAVDNLLSKLVAKKRSLTADWDKFKYKIKLIRIGPESSISEEGIQYSLSCLAQKHVPVKNKDLPEFKAARERKENIIEFAKKYFGTHYGQQLRTCEDILIENSNIICTTLNSCVNGKLTEAVNRGLIKFTCCIIDEATQCHEVEALLPVMLGIDKFVFVGDPKQLNATIINREASNLGYGQSLFSRIANNFTNDPRTPIRMLTDQYRMHPEICTYPNKQFYEGKLRSIPSPLNKLPDNIQPYLVFNCEKVNDCGDYTNLDEVHLIKKLINVIFDLIDNTSVFTFGIITPYNAQKELINKNIADLESKKKNCKITVNTVDSFQGSENDVIIISCVRHSTNSFLQNENRLNVALTRAKQALYIVGNYTLFKECRPLYDLREDAKRRKVLLDFKQNPQKIDNFAKLLIKRD